MKDEMTRRVVVTGLGSINPLGHDVQTVWSNVKEGKSGVDYTTVFDASDFPTKISAEVKDWDVSAVGLDPADWVERGRHTKFAAGAATQAVESSGIMDAGIDHRIARDLERIMLARAEQRRRNRHHCRTFERLDGRTRGDPTM